MTRLILPQTFAGEHAVERGRDAAKRIADTVMDLRARDREVVEVRVSQQVADYMRAYFCSFAQFDGVLPPTVHGIPFAEGDTAGRDFVFRLRNGKPVTN